MTNPANPPFPHLALLGDSIFDNAAYTAGAPDVHTHLRAALPAGWRASLLAVDGSTTADLRSQLPLVADDVTHLVVSIGGNDALENSDLLNLPVKSTAEALLLFGERAAEFRASYAAALKNVLELGRRTTVCTVYEGNLDPLSAPLARTALSLFNDVILRVAFENGVDVIDLRLVCTDPSDYANPIEPSGAGGKKIASTIASAIAGVGGPPSELGSRVFGLGR
jgi:hypothetical protein